jgi:hypothetical protein
MKHGGHPAELPIEATGQTPGHGGEAQSIYNQLHKLLHYISYINQLFL